MRLATGKTDVVLECTRKGNLEYAVAFGILNEAGAVVTNEEGVNIGSRKYLEFGQDKNLPIIASATKPLAQ